jgi:hypothetical protein
VLAQRRRAYAAENAARCKLGIPRLSVSDEALELVEKLLDAAPRVAETTFRLTAAEAEYIRERVRTRARDSLFAFLLSEARASAQGGTVLRRRGCRQLLGQ